MPFIPNTPESLIGRSDSKNPSTTCRGITSGGRPCRRPLNATPGSSPAASPAASPPAISRSRVNRLRVDDPSDPGLYCWQHKDQASSSAKSSPGPASRTKLNPIRQESFESLVDRLGIVEAERKGRKQGGNSARPSDGGRHEKIPQASGAHFSEGPKPERKPKVKKHVSFCCCFTIPVYEEEGEGEEERPPRPKPQPIQNASTKPDTAKLPSKQHLAPAQSSQRPSLAPSKQSSAQSAMSQTSQYLSFIPNSVLPETAASLLKELSKPYSQMDEPGYIYIFWLTPESQPSAPPAEVARDLLAPPPRPEMRQRRTSDVLQSFATQSTRAGASSKTILLKIGRASNVQRRLNEWQRQCGYNISLIRYYPYVSSSRPSTPRKMPHSHKVERLIHIELEGQGLRVNHKVGCDACGKNHREWFEVEATRAGINTVDEIVRRWSDWDEGNPQRF
ncbi:meiotically up-regulated gene 113-domain-containing protein [Xylaria flabelliformis]|nr:meiotically up-regulated gene 113-domain-containing protein [Xylaria flabelliformis]